MKKINVCIFSYAVTRGMKSYGPKGLLKNHRSKELINCQIDSLKTIINDLYVVTGFGADKLNKKIDHDSHLIYNQHYDTFNEGYALKLVLDNSDNILILGDGVILNLNEIPSKESCIIISKKNKHNQNFELGSIVDESTGLLEHIFYDVGTHAWSESVLLLKRELDIIRTYIKKHNIDNMFLFEIINQSIQYGARYKTHTISNKSLKKIQSMKDIKKVRTIV